jgi:hypothetical protein
VVFLDISGAYDNVLIDIICYQMHQAQLLARIVRVMWNLLCWKEMVFYYENRPVAECVGFKGFPHDSVLSPFSYSFYTSQADRVLPVRCSMLQYADDLAVYVSLQSACAGLNEFFRDIGLSISESKSELVLFSRKHTNPSVCVNVCLSCPNFGTSVWCSTENFYGVHTCKNAVNE